MRRLSARLERLRDALNDLPTAVALLVRELPLAVRSTNKRLRGVTVGARRGGASRTKLERRAAFLVVYSHREALKARLPLTVRLVRVAPRELDDDNAVGAMKALRDGLADGLGMNDADPRLVFLPDQERGERALVRVEIYAAEGNR